MVDEGTGSFASHLATQLSSGDRFQATVTRTSEANARATVDSLTRLVQAKQLDGYVAVSPAAIESGQFEYRGRNVASITNMAVLEGTLRQAVTTERLTRRGIDAGLVQEAQQRIHLDKKRITRQGATGETGRRRSSSPTSWASSCTWRSSSTAST